MTILLRNAYFKSPAKESKCFVFLILFFRAFDCYHEMIDNN